MASPQPHSTTRTLQSHSPATQSMQTRPLNSAQITILTNAYHTFQSSTDYPLSLKSLTSGFSVARASVSFVSGTPFIDRFLFNKLLQALTRKFRSYFFRTYTIATLQFFPDQFRLPTQITTLISRSLNSLLKSCFEQPRGTKASQAKSSVRKPAPYAFRMNETVDLSEKEFPPLPSSPPPKLTPSDVSFPCNITVIKEKKKFDISHLSSSVLEDTKDVTPYDDILESRLYLRGALRRLLNLVPVVGTITVPISKFYYLDLRCSSFLNSYNLSTHSLMRMASGLHSPEHNFITADYPVVISNLLPPGMQDYTREPYTSYPFQYLTRLFTLVNSTIFDANDSECLI